MARKQFMGEAPLMEKKSFIKEGEPVLANYSYTDIADGTGVIEFDGFASTDSAGTTYHLTNKPLFSSPATIQASGGGNLDATLTFNLTPFNIPRYLQGTAVVRYSVVAANTSAGTTTFTEYLTIQHVRGAVVTDLGTTTTGTNSVAGDTNISRSTRILRIALTSKQFARGDILRLTLRYVLTRTGGANYVLAFDPLEKDQAQGTATLVSATNPTSLKLNVPFRINA